MVDRGRVEQFLRTLVGLFTVAWVVAALFSPPDPFTFLLLLAAGWAVALPVAVWLVFFHGDERLRESDVYRPGTSGSRATAAFVVLAAVLKAAGTAVVDAAAGPGGAGQAVHYRTSAVVLALAYGVVFLAGLVGRVEGVTRGRGG